METSKPQEDWNSPGHNAVREDNKKLLAGILALFFGYLGIHKFVLGYTQEGLILLAITLISYATFCLLIGFLLVWVPVVVGFIEGIIYLTKTDEAFYQTYQANKRSWF